VAAKSKDLNLYEHFSEIYSEITGENVNSSLPMPRFNILNGGEHAENNIDIQEFMIVPKGANDFSEIMQGSSEIYHNLKHIIRSKNYSTAVGEEGGFAPNLQSNEEALELIIESIQKSNLIPGGEVNIALDCAASEFFEGSNYFFRGENKKYPSSELVNYFENLITKYPIISIEEAMDENDFDGRKLITEKLGNRGQLVGEDLLVTKEKIF
jgi:Enolase